MIGHGRFWALTDRLPHRGAADFSAKLQQRCRCRIVWNRVRGVYVVIQDRGRHIEPQSFMDISMRDLPFNQPLLHAVANAVDLYRGQMAQDAMQVVDACERQRLDENEKDLQKYLQEREYEFMKDLKRMQEVISDGRVRRRFLDLASSA